MLVKYSHEAAALWQQQIEHMTAPAADQFLLAWPSWKRNMGCDCGRWRIRDERFVLPWPWTDLVP